MRPAVPELNGNDPVHRVQASSESLELSGHVTFRGRKFRLGPCEAIAPMLDFAEAAARGVDTDDPAGLAAMKAMIKGCFTLTYSCGTCPACQDDDYDACPQLDLGDFPRFWRLVEAAGVGAEELMGVVEAGMEQAMARPTRAPSGSSSPAPRASGNSKGRSSSPGRVPEAFTKAFEAGDVVDVADALRS